MVAADAVPGPDTKTELSRSLSPPLRVGLGFRPLRAQVPPGSGSHLVPVEFVPDSVVCWFALFDS